MTYGDIYTKFLIEYDKQNITSSYPSLTVYEIATILDKAYLALIAQKLTGNNPRQVPFEVDIKSIEDLRPLVETRLIQKTEPSDEDPNNMLRFDLNKITRTATTVDNKGIEDYDNTEQEFCYLYYIRSTIHSYSKSNKPNTFPIKLINHYDADKFIQSPVNTPWIENPVAYIDNNYLNVFIDKFNYNDDEKHNQDGSNISITYIKKPLGFICFDDKVRFNATPFELSDTMAEELINLAIIMASETVESPKLQTKLQTRALES